MRAAVALLCTFSVGLVAGAFLERLHTVSGSVPESVSGLHRESNAPMISGAALHDAAMASLEEALHLESHQMAEIHGVFQKHQRIVQRSWETMRPSLDIAMQKVHHEVAELLTPEQQTAFTDWLEQHGGRSNHPQDANH